MKLNTNIVNIYLPTDDTRIISLMTVHLKLCDWRSSEFTHKLVFCDITNHFCFLVTRYLSSILSLYTRKTLNSFTVLRSFVPAWQALYKAIHKTCPMCSYPAWIKYRKLASSFRSPSSSQSNILFSPGMNVFTSTPEIVKWVHLFLCFSKYLFQIISKLNTGYYVGTY